MGTQQVAQLVTPHRLAKELQAPNTPTDVKKAVTGMPQPISGKRPQILHGYESESHKNDWSTVWHRVTRQNANNAIIESRVMTTDLPPEIPNAALPRKMDIVTELWYEPEFADHAILNHMEKRENMTNNMNQQDHQQQKPE